MRDATPGYITQATRQMGAVYLEFLYADFGPDAGEIALWNGVGVKTWRGIDYSSGLGYIKAEGGGENIDMTTEPLTFSLAWQDLTTGRDLAQAALTAQSGRRAWLAQGFMDDLGNIIVDPIYLWYGRVGTPSIELGPIDESGARTLVISCTAEENISDRDRSVRFRITYANQLNKYPFDKGLQYQGALDKQDLQWGELYRNRKP